MGSRPSTSAIAETHALGDHVLDGGAPLPTADPQRALERIRHEVPSGSGSACFGVPWFGEAVAVREEALLHDLAQVPPRVPSVGHGMGYRGRRYGPQPARASAIRSGTVRRARLRLQ